MAKHCIECKKKEKWRDRNYAGFNARKDGNHCFPDRIEELTLPGNKKRQFLCNSCANKREVRCRVHGPITDGNFNRGHPPSCKKCDAEFESIKKGSLPQGFDLILPLTSIHTKSKKKMNGGVLAMSGTSELHVIKKRTLFSTSAEKATPAIKDKNGLPVFLLKFPSGSSVTSCEVETRKSAVFGKACGPWVELWSEQIADVLNLESTTDSLCLVSVDEQTVSHESFSTSTNTQQVAICDIHNNKLCTYPDLDLPSLNNLKSWRTEQTEDAQTIEFCFDVDGVPQLVRFEQLDSCGGSLIDKMKKTLPTSKRREQGCDLSSKGLFEATLYPSKEENLTLFEIEDKALYATPLPQGKRIRLSVGFAYGHTHLLVSEHQDILTAEFVDKDAKLVMSSIQAPRKMVEEGNYHWGTFLDRDNPHVAHTVRISSNTVAIDDRQPVLIGDFQDKVPVNNVDDELSEIVLKWEGEGREETLHLVCPEPLAYNVSQKLEISRAETGFDSMEIQDFYRRYGELKVNNLLFVLFSDIIILNRELNIGKTMDDLAAELEVIGDKDFYKSKKLREQTLQKLLLLYTNLPRIEMRLEYLANYYPYYLAHIEESLIKDAFGEDKLREVWPSEDRRIRGNAGQTVRLLQSNMQRVLSRIERAVHPVQAVYNKDKIQSQWITRLRQNAVNYAPLGLMVALLAAGGGFSFLGGVYGIRAVGDVAKHFEKDRLAAARIRRTATEVLPWWKLFMSTLQVNIKETSERLCDENLRCVQRDRQIYDSFLSRDRRNVRTNLLNALQKRILAEINNQFVEVMEGSGIRFGAIVSDIELLNEVDIRKKTDDYDPLLPWT
jgi:hypothetical protein